MAGRSRNLPLRTDVNMIAKMPHPLDGRRRRRRCVVGRLQFGDEAQARVAIRKPSEGEEHNRKKRSRGSARGSKRRSRRNPLRPFPSG